MNNNLQKIRWEKGMTLHQLSQLSGVSYSELNKIENMETNDIFYSTACRIARALGVTLETLFPY